MAQVNMANIRARIQTWSQSAAGKARMETAISQNTTGVSGTGDMILTKNKMLEAAGLLIRTIQATAASFDLPESVARHFQSLSYSPPTKQADGTYSVSICFHNTDLSRGSLYSENYPEGLENIIILFNNTGNKPDNYAYGTWHGVRIRSHLHQRGLQFMQKAVYDFNQFYGAKYHAIASVGEKYER